MNRNILKKLMGIILISILVLLVQRSFTFAASHTHTRDKNGFRYIYECKEAKGTPACTESSKKFFNNPEVYFTDRVQLGAKVEKDSNKTKVESNTSNNKLEPKKLNINYTHYHEVMEDGITYVHKCTEKEGSPACNARLSQFNSNPERYGVEKYKLNQNRITKRKSSNNN